MQSINIYKLIELVTFIFSLCMNSADAQDSFYIQYSNIRIDTIHMDSMNSIEYQNFIKESRPVINFYTNRKAIIGATSYRIKERLGVTNQTISDILSIFRSDELLLLLNEYNYDFEPSLLLDIMAISDLHIVAQKPNKKEYNLTENLEETYAAVENNFLNDLVKMQEANLKMGNFFYHRDTTKALGFYLKIFKFPYYKYHLNKEENKPDNFKLSSKLFILHEKAFKKIVTLNQGNRENLEIIKNGKNYYNNCCHNVPELRALLNEHLVEVGLKPIE